MIQTMQYDKSKNGFPLAALLSKAKLTQDDIGALLVEARLALPAYQIAITPPIIDEWIQSDVTIEEPQGDTMSVIPFHLWPAQQDALDCLQQQAQVIILKARQLGISWLCIAYALHLCLFHPNKLVMVFSKDQDSANEMIRRAKGVYQRLRHKSQDMTIDNVTTIGWGNGSRIKSFAATEDAGSSYTASLTIIDEFAKMRYADELYTSVKPTIADGGKMIVISTARGENNPFHKLWDSAIKKLNNFTPLFLPWTARPDRTVEWYAAMEADAISSAHHRQEYPAEPAEAFQTIGDERFVSNILLWDACRDELPALQPHEPIVLALDAGVSSDSFGLIGVTKHPTKDGYAVRLIHEWTPPRGGQVDFYGDESAPGPDWLIRNVIVPHYAVAQIVYDPYQLHSLCTKLVNDGVVWCQEFPQGTDRIEADKNLLDMIMARRIWHDGNEALRRHIDNANRKLDGDARKLRIVKREGSLKIDLAVTLSMALLSAQRLGL